MDDEAANSGDRALDEIARFVEGGNWREARARCESLLARAPQHAEALAWLGRVSMGEFRWADAIAAFDRALRIRVDPWSLGNLGVCHWKLGALDEAEYCLRGAVEIKPNFVRGHVSLANVLHGLKRFDDALTELEVAEALDGADHLIPMRRGCALAALGRFDEAQQAFAQSARMAGRFSYPRLVAFDRATFDAVRAPQQEVTPPALVSRAGVGDGDVRYVVLISCNPPYVRKYGFPFMRSFAVAGGGAGLLHLHVYDPDDTLFDEVAEVASRSGLARYTMTAETCPFPPHEAKQRKAYYACGRLVHLPYWLDEYRCPVLSLDADFIVESALDGLVEAAAARDVGLNPRDPVDSPWLDIIANIIVANPTAASRRYFAAVKNYALACLRREREAWLVDQSALYCVLKMSERYGEAPSVAWFGPGEQACLWHIGHAYDHLLNDPRYRKYADAPPA